MSTPVEEFVAACFDELRLSQRFVPYIQRAEAAGFPQLAKMFRAVAAKEAAQEALYRSGLVHQAAQTGDYYVCPHCGLIYDIELPEQCVVDQTPGEEFIVIQ